MPPTIFILFGVTGDLATKKLLPALASLFDRGFLPKQFMIVGFARRPFTDESFSQEIQKTHSKYSADFISHIQYVRGDFDTVADYHHLATRLAEIDEQWGTCSEKIFHLSISPFLYKEALEHLEASGLTISCVDSPGKTKILIEKPIGFDQKTGSEMNELLATMFPEEQIYRIDHYLLKCSLLSFTQKRHKEPDLAKLWNKEYVASVEIVQYENRDVDNRATFYDKVGALRDVGQNHLLEMAALIVAEDNTPQSRTQVLQQAHVSNDAVRAQYVGYQSLPGVAQNTPTETAVSFSMTFSLQGWEEVAFTLSTAKAVKESFTKIVLTMRDGGVVALNIQPEPSMSIDAYGQQKTWTLEGNDACAIEGYERVYHDTVKGERNGFVLAEELDECWRIADAVRAQMLKNPLILYEKGSEGKILLCSKEC